MDEWVNMPIQYLVQCRQAVQEGRVLALALTFQGLAQCDKVKCLQGCGLSSVPADHSCLWERGPVWPGLLIFRENLDIPLSCKII